MWYCALPSFCKVQSDALMDQFAGNMKERKKIHDSVLDGLQFWVKPSKNDVNL